LSLKDIKIKCDFFKKYTIIDVEQLICKIFILNSYFIIVMLCKDNNISFAYLIFDKKILSAKAIKIDVALF